MEEQIGWCSSNGPATLSSRVLILYSLSESSSLSSEVSYSMHCVSRNQELLNRWFMHGRHHSYMVQTRFSCYYQDHSCQTDPSSEICNILFRECHKTYGTESDTSWSLAIQSTNLPNCDSSNSQMLRENGTVWVLDVCNLPWLSGGSWEGWPVTQLARTTLVCAYALSHSKIPYHCVRKESNARGDK